MSATQVFITDVDLVFLYRYNTFDDDGVLDNSSESPVYTGLNTMSISGAIEKVAGPGSNAPYSSGARMSGTQEIFHLPYSPAQSGNASGISAESTQDMSFGGWFLSPFTADFEDFMGMWAFANGMRSYGIQARTGASPVRVWNGLVGASNGDSTVTVGAGVTAAASQYEHVVCTVDADSSTNNVVLFVSGIQIASGSTTFSPGTSGAHPSFRIGGLSAGGSEGILNGVSTAGGQVAETFLIRRTLTPEEVSGVYTSGFTYTPGSVDDSDTLDTQKDNQPSGVGTPATIVLTAWDATDSADPSGIRHTTSGFHPAFIKILDIGGGSGLDFGTFVQGVPSPPKAITFRANDTGNILHNMRFWSSDLSAFDGIIGYEPTLHINSDWLPNLVLPSGSGIVGKTLGAASSVLRSDGNTSLSGYVTHDASQSGEQEVSQYIYLAIDTSADMTADDYGYSGFEFRVTYDTENI